MATNSFGLGYQPLNLGIETSPLPDMTNTFGTGYGSVPDPFAAMNPSFSGLGTMPSSNLNLQMPTIGLDGSGYASLQPQTNGLNLGSVGQQPQGMSMLGKIGTGLQIAQGLFSAYQGYEATKLAKKQLGFATDSFNKQWDAQRNLTNSRLEGRQEARVRRNPGAYQSVSEYMNKYGI